LCFPIEDDEHLFTVIVEVRSNATSGRDNASMKKEEIGAKVELCNVWAASVVERHVIHRTCTVVYRRHVVVFRWIGVSDPLGERRRCGCTLLRQGNCGTEKRKDQGNSEEPVKHLCLLFSWLYAV
jgi:hypothetical protein